jgi:putative phosphoesterase
MSSYAIFSDVHGNLEALKSVWLHFEELKVSQTSVFNAGDTVAHGPESADCIEFVRRHEQIISVAGNYDINVGDYPEKHEKFERKWSRSRPDKLEHIRAASEQISSDQRGWLLTLPKLVALEVEGLRVALCHYSPIGLKVGVGTWTSGDDLLAIANSCSYDVIITGHTHTPSVRRAGATLFINPGSVGLSWSQPTFAVMTITEGAANGAIRT